MKISIVQGRDPQPPLGTAAARPREFIPMVLCSLMLPYPRRYTKRQWHGISGDHHPMAIHVESLRIPEVKLVTPSIFRDPRGFFSETYNGVAMASEGIDAKFVQDNHSLSRTKGVIRGLHYQIAPHAQGKLVRVIRGAILDVAVDIRRGSPHFGQHVAVTLSAENWSQLWIPAGFAHGFCTLEPDTEVIYKVTEYYAPECDRGIAFNDPALGISWPIPLNEATLSEKDLKHPMLAELDEQFVFSKSHV